jgi:hypothetical protein
MQTNQRSFIYHEYGSSLASRRCFYECRITTPTSPTLRGERERERKGKRERKRERDRLQKAYSAAQSLLYVYYGSGSINQTRSMTGKSGSGKVVPTSSYRIAENFIYVRECVKAIRAATAGEEEYTRSTHTFSSKECLKQSISQPMPHQGRHMY